MNRLQITDIVQVIRRPSPVYRYQLLPAEAMRTKICVVIGDDGSTGRRYFVDASPVFICDLHLDRAQVIFELFHRAGTHNRAGDAWLSDAPGQSQLADLAALLSRYGLEQIHHVIRPVGEMAA